jgi:hypothetical protein
MALPFYLPKVRHVDRGWPPLRARGTEWAEVVGRRIRNVEPGCLLGEDAALLEATEGELTLLRTLRMMGMTPPEVLALIVQARSTAMRSSSPSM